MPRRITCQITLFIVWFIGLIIAVALYQSALFHIRGNPLVLFDGVGPPPGGWMPAPNWEEMIADKYEAPLAAIYTPWLLVMVGAVLSSAQQSSKERISGWVFAMTFILSICFNVLVCFMLWEFLFDSKPLVNAIPSKSPLVALLVSIVGAFVTYNFPKAEAPAANGGLAGMLAAPAEVKPKPAPAAPPAANGGLAGTLAAPAEVKPKPAPAAPTETPE
jgi:hypothetical protein